MSQSDTAPQRSAGEPSHDAAGAKAGALLTTVFALQFLVALDMSLVNVALPSIRADLGFSAAGLQWVVNGYLLTFAGLLLLGGRLGDLLGRRRVIVIGLAVFAAASVLGGCATAAWVLVAARAIQGIAGALLAPASLALVSTVGDDRKKAAMSLWAAAGATGGAVGVVLSGVLTQWWSWRAVLLVNVPIIAIALLATLIAVPRDDARGTSRPDVAGAATVTLGVGSLVYAVSSGETHGWTSLHVIGGLVLAIVLLSTFVAIERAAREPIMPLRLLGTRSVIGANLLGFMIAAGQLAAFYFCTLYVQTVWSVEPGLAGVLFLPFSACVFLGIMTGNHLSSVIGPRHAVTLLSLLCAVGLTLFSRMPTHFDFWLGMMLPSAVTAIGVGGAMVLIGSAGMSDVAPHDVGVASGVLNSSRQLGGTIGLAVLVAIAAQTAAPQDGYRLGFLVGAVLVAVGAVAAWLVLPTDRRSKTKIE